MTNEQLITDLTETRRQLEVRGRCIADLVNSEGKVCLDGAILAATLGEVANTIEGYSLLLGDDPRARAVAQALFEQIPDDHPSFLDKGKSRLSAGVAVFYVNDYPDTTDQDCFDLIDKALAEVGGLSND